VYIVLLLKQVRDSVAKKCGKSGRRSSYFAKYNFEPVFAEDRQQHRQDDLRAYQRV